MKKKRTNFSDAVGDNIKKQEESKQNYGYLNLPKDVKLLKLEDGVARIDLDFLPYEVTDQNHPDKDEEKGYAMAGDLWFRRPFSIHRGVGADNETVICPTSFGKKCPICEHRVRRAKEGADKDELRELYPKRRSLYVVIPLGIKKYDEKPCIWDMSNELFQEIFNEESKINPEIKKFANLEDGVTLSLKLRWKKFGSSSFPETRSIDANERQDYKESILEEVPNLDEILKLLSYEKIEAKFLEIDKEDTGGSLHEVDENEDKHSERSERSRGSREERPERTERRGREEEPESRSRERNTDKEERTERSRPSRASEEERSSRGTKEEDKPERGSRPAKSNSDPECPHGHVFGEDAEKFPKHCDTCEIWGKCLDKKEGK